MLGFFKGVRRVRRKTDIDTSVDAMGQAAVGGTGSYR